MGNSPLNLTTQDDSSAAVTPQKIYSAKELAEMMNTHPDQLADVNIGACTDWYRNEDYMEEIISYLETEESIDQLIKFILLRQKYDIYVNKHPKVCYRVPNEQKYAPYISDLSEKLSAIRTRELQKREIIASLEEMKTMWSSTGSVSEDSIQTFESKTTSPQFGESSIDGNIKYHLEDLPQDVRDQMLIETDKLYTVFVETMQGPVNSWIKKRHLQDWSVVRFICRLRGIVTRKCSIVIFGKLLEKIGLGNQENNMKQRKDGNDNNAMIAYDDPSNSNVKFWCLKKDGKEIEKLLETVIKEMAA